MNNTSSFTMPQRQQPLARSFKVFNFFFFSCALCSIWAGCNRKFTWERTQQLRDCSSFSPLPLHSEARPIRKHPSALHCGKRGPQVPWDMIFPSLSVDKWIHGGGWERWNFVLEKCHSWGNEIRKWQVEITQIMTPISCSFDMVYINKRIKMVMFMLFNCVRQSNKQGFKMQMKAAFLAITMPVKPHRHSRRITCHWEKIAGKIH